MTRFIHTTTAVLLLAALAAPADADVRTETIEYRHGEKLLEGYLAWDGAAEGKRPLVLVVHEWYGLNDYARLRARQLAQMGYTAFAVDMYGKGVLAKNHQEARRLSSAVKGDRKMMRERIRQPLEVLKDDPRVDTERVGAIGYCFGGTVVLELARSGAEVDGVVSFHGGLDTPDPNATKNVKAGVLVCSGAADRSVPLSQVGDFMAEMRRAGVDYQVILYGGAVHSFTNPASGDDPSTNVAYDPKAARRSWEDMRDFLAEVLEHPADRREGK